MKRIRRCPLNCPQLVKGKNSKGKYFQCCIHKVVVKIVHKSDGNKYPLMGAVTLKTKNGYPLKGDWCKKEV